MSDETLELLQSFRREISEPDGETAARVYRRAVNSAPRRSDPSWLLRRTSSHRRLVLVVTLGALVLVPAAVAVGGKVLDLFQGSTPTPAVSTAYETMNSSADAMIKQGFADRFPKSDLNKLHGVIEIQTTDGPQDLWAAPNDSGGQCFFVDFASDPASASGKAGNGTCDSTTTNASTITVASFWTLAHRDISTAYGRVRVPAASVKLTLADGSAVAAPVVESFFLVSLKKGGQVARVTAYNTAGNQVADWTPPQ
jgi:hypothetical protein